MQIVIDICESAYKEMCEYGVDRVDYDIQNMIMNGTVLPEHGRLIDADAVIKDLNTLKDAFVINFDKTTGKVMGIACTAPTILEATGVEE